MDNGNQANSQAASTETNSPSFDLSAFNSDILNTDIDKNRPGSVEKPASDSAAQKEPEKKAPAESAPAKADATQEANKGGTSADGANDGSTPEARLSAAQRKIHEQAEALKMTTAQINELKGQLTQKQIAVFDAILEQQKKANAPKVPTPEEVEKQFNQVVEQSPFQAVKLLIETALASAIKDKPGEMLTREEAAKIANNVVGQYQTKQRIDANCVALKSKPQFSSFDQDFDAFSQSLWKEYGFLGDRAQEAVVSVFADPALLEAKYTAHLYMTKGAEAFAKKTAAEEAAIAAKLMQNPGTGKAGDIDSKKPKMVKEEITSGFANYW